MLPDHDVVPVSSHEAVPGTSPAGPGKSRAALPGFGRLAAFLCAVALSASVVLECRAAGIRLDPSLQATADHLALVPCLTEEEYATGLEVLRGLGYTDQRIFRRLAVLPGFQADGLPRAYLLLVEHRFSFAQARAFEAWTTLAGANAALAMKCLPEIARLDLSAARSFRRYCRQIGGGAASAIQVIGLLRRLDDVQNRAARRLFAVQGLDTSSAIEALAVIGGLPGHQARAAGAFAATQGATGQGVLEALQLIRYLRPDDAWNARTLFLQDGMTQAQAWNYLVGYFATLPEVQQAQYYHFSPKKRSRLLRAFHEGAEELIWKINNLHAITDRFGMEISRRTLARMSGKQLRRRFEALSPKIQFRFGRDFYAAYQANRPGRMIRILRRATAEDRRQTARDLTAANIYALLCRGSELYDSSFRDILVPILKNRIEKDFSGDLLRFLHETDPDSSLVSDFIVSLAQKGKLTVFFPKDEVRQRRVLQLVAGSAFRSTDAIILFSATFTHLLELLEPAARSYLVERMIHQADLGEALYSRLVSVILQYYLETAPDLLRARDRLMVARLLTRHGAVDLGTYLETPFAEWKKDRRLASISVFHPDDDGRDSFVSNGKTLLAAGYRPDISSRYRLARLDGNEQQAAQAAVALVQEKRRGSLARLFDRMAATPFAVVFGKQVGPVRIEHTVTVYHDPGLQERLIKQFLESGDEMFAQRGHSYWRSEQIIEPLQALLEEGRIPRELLTSKQRFLSLGSCGGVKAYTQLMDLFAGRVDILATIGTGLSIVNDPYNARFLEIVATNPSTITWEDVARQSANIFGKGYGRDYLQPGSLPAILHKILHEPSPAGGEAR